MNLTFSNLPKVFIDTTVLCGALFAPAGINRALIELAGTPILFTPVLSNVCLLEFYRNAINGLGKRASYQGTLHSVFYRFV